MTALVIPIPIAVWPHSQTYDELAVEVSERNLLVAENLGRVLERYDRDVKAEFRLLVLTVADGLDPAKAHVLLENPNFRHI